MHWEVRYDMLYKACIYAVSAIAVHVIPIR